MEPKQSPLQRKLSKDISLKQVNDLCARCGKTVYPVERLVLENPTYRKIFHKRCFRCAVCQFTLTWGNYVMYDNDVHCNAHFQQIRNKGEKKQKHGEKVMLVKRESQKGIFPSMSMSEVDLKSELKSPESPEMAKRQTTEPKETIDSPQGNSNETKTVQESEQKLETLSEPIQPIPQEQPPKVQPEIDSKPEENGKEIPQPVISQESHEEKNGGTNNKQTRGKIVFGEFSTKGKRKTNEDAHLILLSIPEEPTSAFFGVWDGHGGKKASAYCKKKMIKHIATQENFATDKINALLQGFIKTDEKYLGKYEEDGCTVVVTILTEDNQLYVAHAGDSRCVVSTLDGKALTLTTDHKPNDELEKQRIESTVHEVQKDTILFNGKRVFAYRIDGIISVSRSIGDSNFKDNQEVGPEAQAITCIPDISQHTIQNGQLIILACDGLWDVLTDQQVVDFILENKKSQDLQKIASNLAEKAIELGSADNISVVIVSVENS